MSIKFTLLLAFVLTSLNVNTSPLICQAPDIADTPVLQNEIEVIIDDASYTLGDTYTINVYHLGTLYSYETTDSPKTMVNIPHFWRDSLIVEVEKHPVNARITKGAIKLHVIAQEVFWPGPPQAIVMFQQL